MPPNTTNDNEKRQQRESLSGAFDDLVKSNLLLVKAIQEAVPVIRQTAPVTRKWFALVGACALASLLASSATFLTVRSIREENRALLAAFTEACSSKDIHR